jgi:hypothetical protein
MAEDQHTKIEPNLQSQEIHCDPDVNRLIHPLRMIIAGKTFVFNYLLLK